MKGQAQINSKSVSCYALDIGAEISRVDLNAPNRHSQPLGLSRWELGSYWSVATLHCETPSPAAASCQRRGPSSRESQARIARKDRNRPPARTNKKKNKRIATDLIIHHLPVAEASSAGAAACCARPSDRERRFASTTGTGGSGDRAGNCAAPRPAHRALPAGRQPSAQPHRARSPCALEAGTYLPALDRPRFRPTRARARPARAPHTTGTPATNRPPPPLEARSRSAVADARVSSLQRQGMRGAPATTSAWRGRRYKIVTRAPRAAHRPLARSRPIGSRRTCFPPRPKLHPCRRRCQPDAALPGPAEKVLAG